MIKLNNMQQKAVEQIQGPLLILAGAGSGKTRTLTERIACIIKSGVARPYEILAITFTNKAAAEMRARISGALGDTADDMWIMTFHAACTRILRRNIESWNKGYTSHFTIYDDDDSMSLIKNIMKEMNISDKYYTPRGVRYHIGMAKNNLQDPDEYCISIGADFRAKKIAEIYTQYEQKMRAANALDFDDLLLVTLRLFVDCPQVLDYYRSRFKFISVDEYQDTNKTQYELVKLLASGYRNLCVVGDDDQSIYGWRGADINNILDFEKDFEEAQVIRLEQNYRSTSNILDAANAVIDNNKKRKKKQLWTERGEGDPVHLYRANTDREEAQFIVNEIISLASQYSYSDFAVLYRTNAQSRTVEDALMRSGIPYRMYGGLRFYDRKEIKDVIAYIRLVNNPSDDVALARIINVPKRGIGDTTVERLAGCAASRGESLFKVMNDTALVESEVSRAASKIRAFIDKMNEMGQIPRDDLTEYIRLVMEKSGLVEMYEQENTDEAEGRLENMGELLSAVRQYTQENENASIEDFLENVALVSDLDLMEDRGRPVTLMTMHASKGLEFPVVFLCGAEEGLFPHSRAFDNEDDMEEERRLCYVAMTRAMDRLYITHSISRMMYGNMQYNMPSRFIHETPKSLVLDRSPKPAASEPVSIPGRSSFNFSEYLKSSAQKNSTKPTQSVDFSIGDRVEHSKFGKGMIVNITGTEPKRVFAVAFEGQGVKELAEQYAPLKKI